MTDKKRKQLEMFQELGFNTMRLGYEDLVEEILHKYIEVSMALEYTNYENFRKELERIKKPTN